MNAHTPGPWTVVGVDELLEFDSDLVDPNAWIIVRVTEPKTDDVNGRADVICDVWTLDGGNGTRRDEEVANARLIAAAPELLNLLDAVRHALLSYAHGNASPDLAREVVAVIDVTIAKVEPRR